MSYKSEKAKDEFELLKKGKYLAKVEDVFESMNFDKTSLQLVVKWRLANKRVMFDHINKDRSSTEDYDHRKVGNILYATGCGDVSGGIDDLKKALTGKECIIEVDLYFSKHKNDNINVISNYFKKTEAEPTDFGNKKAPSGKSAGSGNTECSDADLPF